MVSQKTLLLACRKRVGRNQASSLFVLIIRDLGRNVVLRLGAGLLFRARLAPPKVLGTTGGRQTACYAPDWETSENH